MGIERRQIKTKEGNTLELFYNPDNNLVVLDLIHSSETGDNELYRRKINENELLKHTIS
jgi:hypothetical protein